MVYSEWAEARKNLDEKFREDTIELIKTQMELDGCTLREYSDIIGVNVSIISKIMNRKYLPECSTVYDKIYKYKKEVPKDYYDRKIKALERQIKKYKSMKEETL